MKYINEQMKKDVKMTFGLAVGVGSAGFVLMILFITLIACQCTGWGSCRCGRSRRRGARRVPI